ncbi:uncharacterized protein LOC142333277 isoform X2 [Lycorma delicatula]|uniref:uncharacterized protein LOC142333277 isoform X2 n=1 Tax=Lycorma delicatula TaxID=130591 RepID=UPI003F517336
MQQSQQNSCHSSLMVSQQQPSSQPCSCLPNPSVTECMDCSYAPEVVNEPVKNCGCAVAVNNKVEQVCSHSPKVPCELTCSTDRWLPLKTRQPSQGPCSKHCMNGRCAKMNSFAYGSSTLQQFSFPAVNNQKQNRSILLKNCIPSNLSRMCVSDMQEAHSMKKSQNQFQSMAASSLPRRQQQNGNDCLSAKKYCLVCGVEVKTGNKFGSSFANSGDCGCNSREVYDLCENGNGYENGYVNECKSAANSYLKVQQNTLKKQQPQQVSFRTPLTVSQEQIMNEQMPSTVMSKELLYPSSTGMSQRYPCKQDGSPTKEILMAECCLQTPSPPTLRSSCLSDPPVMGYMDCSYAPEVVNEPVKNCGCALAVDTPKVLCKSPCCSANRLPLTTQQPRAKMNSFTYHSRGLRQLSFPAVNNEKQSRSISFLKNSIPSNLSRASTSVTLNSFLMNSKFKNVKDSLDLVRMMHRKTSGTNSLQSQETDSMQKSQNQSETITSTLSGSQQQQNGSDCWSKGNNCIICGSEVKNGTKFTSSFANNGNNSYQNGERPILFLKKPLTPLNLSRTISSDTLDSFIINPNFKNVKDSLDLKRMTLNRSSENSSQSLQINKMQKSQNQSQLMTTSSLTKRQQNGNDSSSTGNNCIYCGAEVKNGTKSASLFANNGNCSDNSGGISDLNENGSKNENESESVASIYLNTRTSSSARTSSMLHFLADSKAPLIQQNTLQIQQSQQSGQMPTMINISQQLLCPSTGMSQLYPCPEGREPTKEIISQCSPPQSSCSCPSDPSVMDISCAPVPVANRSSNKGPLTSSITVQQSQGLSSKSCANGPRAKGGGLCSKSTLLIYHSRALQPLSFQVVNIKKYDRSILLPKNTFKPIKPMKPLRPPLQPQRPLKPLKPPLQPQRPLKPLKPPLQPQRPLQPLKPPLQPQRPLKPLKTFKPSKPVNLSIMFTSGKISIVAPKVKEFPTLSKKKNNSCIGFQILINFQ